MSDISSFGPIASDYGFDNSSSFSSDFSPIANSSPVFDYSSSLASLGGLEGSLMDLQMSEFQNNLNSQVNQALISNAWTRVKDIAGNLIY